MDDILKVARRGAVCDGRIFHPSGKVLQIPLEGEQLGLRFHGGYEERQEEKYTLEALHLFGSGMCMLHNLAWTFVHVAVRPLNMPVDAFINEADVAARCLLLPVRQQAG